MLLCSGLCLCLTPAGGVSVSHESLKHFHPEMENVAALSPVDLNCKASGGPELSGRGRGGDLMEIEKHVNRGKKKMSDGECLKTPVVVERCYRTAGKT